ncbi:BTB (POZ) domain containing 9 [Carabus blaptoides fortunei]
MAFIMSSHQYLGPQSSGARQGDIEHTGQLSEHLGSLCCNKEYADVTFVIEGQQIHAHKILLAVRSEYFRALLFGGMREASQDEIELKGTPLQAFKVLLRYIYTGHMSLMSIREDVVLDTLGLANQYGFQDLETSISDHLRQILALRNVCAILDNARLFGLNQLVKVCYSFMDRHASEILRHESIVTISQATFREVLLRDSFFAPEVEIFKGVCKWCHVNTDSENLVLNCVRLPLMSVFELLSVVRPAGLVNPDSLLDAIAERTNSRSTLLPHRGQLLCEENVASSHMGSSVISGELREFLLDGDTVKYDMERGYTRHAINGPGDTGIVIKLGTPSIINHIKMLLWDRDLRSYSYYIEVSMEQKDWIRVVDHSGYYCRSWQYLYFDSRVVLYLRVVGTNNTVNKVFHVVSCEAMYKMSIPRLSSGLIVPKHNVATMELSASVIEGVSRSRNALLNGDTQHYDWDSGYTCHQLGSGTILIQLGQPYMLASMRLLLWDCDERSYSYYIETSRNMWDWEIVADRTREACHSWQSLRFTPRPVVFIRIVGTHNTANEVFHCVHFECPAQDVDTSHSPIRMTGVKKSNPVPPALCQLTQPTETATEAAETIPCQEIERESHLRTCERDTGNGGKGDSRHRQGQQHLTTNVFSEQEL